jgi:hypothetical protein
MFTADTDQLLTELINNVRVQSMSSAFCFSNVYKALETFYINKPKKSAINCKIITCYITYNDSLNSTCPVRKRMLNTTDTPFPASGW